MELKLRKYIKNTRSLPRFDDGTSSTSNLTQKTFDDGASLIGPAATGVINTAASIYDAHLFSNTSDDYINKYGTTNQHIGDIGYTRFVDINRDAEMDLVKKENTANTFKTTAAGMAAGAAIGTIVPGVGNLVGAGVGALIGGLGGLVGGIFGGKSRKRKAERLLKEAQQRVDNYNEMNRSDALTAQLAMNQAEKYGDTRSQQLYGYDLGKNEFVDPATRQTVDDFVVETSNGQKINKQNSWLSKGEGVWNPLSGTAHLVLHGPDDTARANLKNSDVVFGSLTNPFTGNKFKEDAAPYIAAKEKINKMRPKGTGWLSKLTQETYENATKPLNNQIDAALSNLRDVQKYTSAESDVKNGMPGFKKKKDGNIDDYGLNWYGNAIPSALGAIAGLGQYFDAKRDTPYKPDTYTANRFLNRGLRTLGELNISSYPIIQLLRDAEARAAYAVNASGGLSTAQKNLARLSSLHGTLLLIGNALQSILQLNNAYKAAYANAMLLSGESEAKRRQQAKQYDLDYYSKAHGARLQMMQQGLYNFLENVNQYAANEFKRKSAIANIGTYRQALKIQEDALKNNDTPSITSPATTNTSPVVDVYNPHMVLAPKYLEDAGLMTNPIATPPPALPKWKILQNLWIDDINKKYGW